VTDVVNTRSGVKVTVKSQEEAAPGDKIVFRSGQKGTISKIIPNNHMPRTNNGDNLEVLMNPLGIPSRVNNSMIYELLLGKVAKAKGKNYKLSSFTKPGEKWFDFVRKELDDNGIADTEEVFDPQANRKLKKPVTVGDAYMWKLHHTAQKGFSARSQGAYDINEQPLKGGDELAQSKRLSGLETHGLLSSGSYGVLKDMSVLRGARNDDYWHQLRSGYDPKMPDTPMVFNKFKTLLQGAGYHARQTNKKGELRLGPLTEKILDDLKPVEVQNPGLVEARQLAKGSVVPTAGGLFDDRLTFGNKYGFMKLPFEIPNPAFEEPVRKILGLTEKQFRAIMSGKEELPPELVTRMAKFVKK
jgi:DNA-directed RNA polymerase subunit beta